MDENKDVSPEIHTRQICEGGEKREIAVNTTKPLSPVPPPFSSSSGAQIKPAESSGTSDTPAKVPNNLSDV